MVCQLRLKTSDLKRLKTWEAPIPDLIILKYGQIFYLKLSIFLNQLCLQTLSQN